MFEDYEIDEAFLKFLSTYLKSWKCSSKAKIKFLDEFIDKLEKYIEVLEAQIQSHSIHYQNPPFGKLFLPKQEDTMIPYDFFD